MKKDENKTNFALNKKSKIYEKKTYKIYKKENSLLAFFF